VPFGIEENILVVSPSPDEHYDFFVPKLSELIGSNCGIVRANKYRTFFGVQSRFRRTRFISKNSSDPPAPELPKRSIDFALTMPPLENNIDVNRTLRIAALDVAVGRIGFERVVAETTGRPALAT
jgi:hypothetical protein